MGVSVVVGALADLIGDDEEGADWFREELVAINQLLELNNLPPHSEPEKLPALNNRTYVDSYPYSFIHYLRRVYANWSLDPEWVAVPVAEGESPTDDPAIEKTSDSTSSHLLCHSDAEGFYLPIKFSEVLLDDTDQVSGYMVGSSYALLEELISIAFIFGIQLTDGELSDVEVERIIKEIDAEGVFFIEKIVWLSLFEAARLSIAHKTVIQFT